MTGGEQKPHGPGAPAPAEHQTFFSSNVVAGEVCFRHGGPPEGTGPVFRCEECGYKFCPLDTAGAWHQGEAGGHRYVWYHCPNCPVGLAFIAIPLAGEAPRDDASGTDLWKARAVSDPELLEARPGAYRLRFPAVKRRGAYEAFWDGGEQRLLELDGREWVNWVQRDGSVELTAGAAVSPEALLPLEEGEYLLVEPPRPSGGLLGRGAASLALLLLLPQGYQEYELPEGWSRDGLPRPLRITDRIWDREGLLRVLPGLAGTAGPGRGAA